MEVILYRYVVILCVFFVSICFSPQERSSKYTTFTSNHLSTKRPLVGASSLTLLTGDSCFEMTLNGLGRNGF